MTTERVSTPTKLLYGVGSVAFGVKDNGFSYLLLIYYNQVLGLPYTLVGLALMTALMVDAILDPLIGYASDNLHSRWGRRHPFMYAAALPLAVAYALLWNPPALSQNGLLAYLAGMAITVRILVSLYEIPSSALSAELSSDYDQRTSLLSYRYFAGWIGGLTMALLAFSVFLQPTAQTASGVLNAEGYRLYGLVAALLILAAILASSLGTHSRIPLLRPPPGRRAPDLARSARELRETLANPSFLALGAGAVIGAVATGLGASLYVYFQTYFWRLSSDQISSFAIANFASAAIALVAAPRLAARFGKKPVAIAASLTAIFSGPAPVVARLLGVFPSPDSGAFLPILIGVNLVTVTLSIVSAILVSSMMADVVEDSELATGRRSEGVFFSAIAFISKCGTALGLLASTLLLRAIDFPQAAPPEGVSDAVLQRLGVAYVAGLGVLHLGSIAMLRGYRISRASHAANLQRLA